ncbi:MAG: ribosome maturation factor RimM [Alphaproteobacteria bacterium]
MKQTQHGNDRLLVGVITGPHGVRGAVRVKSFTAEPDGIADYGRLTDKTGTTAFDLHVTGMAKGLVIASIDGINDRNMSETLKGMELYVERAALPEIDASDEYYFADLIGLNAVTADGDACGSVLAVHDFGAGSVLELRLVDGDTVFLPFTDAAVPSVNLSEGTLVADLSVLDDPDEGDAS